MPIFRLTSSLALAVVAVILCPLLPVGSGCDPDSWRPRTALEELVLSRADEYAVYGRVADKVPDPGRPGGEMSIASIAVLCILKGSTTSATISIGDVGFDGGWCDSTDMEVEVNYLMFLRSSDSDRYSYTVSSRFRIADNSALMTLGYACDIHPTYPYGYNSGDDYYDQFRCPEPAPAEECYDRDYFDQQNQNIYPHEQ